MNVDCFNIVILDMQENNRELIYESAQVDSCLLVYNGVDNKFSNLMTSELQFTMLVKDSGNAVFAHLFTGNEKRYKVLLEDASDENDLKVVWSGFLLPEFFSEPYTNGGFFVSFVATDGIGLLKKKEYPNFGLIGKVNVIEVLMSCLELTGQDLPLLFAPAIQNSGFTLDYLDLLIDTSSYKEIDEDGNVDVMSAYDVLVAVLESIGCKLFLYNDSWYCIGLTRFNEQKINFTEYKYNLGSGVVNNGLIELERDVLRKKWFDAPVISIEPVLNDIEISWDWKSDKFLIPENVVNCFPVDYDLSALSGEMKYLKVKSNPDGKIVASTLYGYMDPDFDYSRLATDAFSYVRFPIKQNFSNLVFGPVVSIRSGSDSQKYDGLEYSSVQLSDLSTNYVCLKEDFFVYGSSDEKRDVTLDLEFEVSVYNSHDDSRISLLKQKVEDDVFLNHFHFSIVKKKHKNEPDGQEVFFLSTLEGNLPKGLFEFKQSVDGGVLRVVAKLNSFLFLEDGYYNIRLYPVVHDEMFAAIVFYKRLNLKISLPKTNKHRLSLDTGFTTSFSKKVFHSSSRMNLSSRSFLFSERLQGLMDSGSLVSQYLEVRRRYYRKTEDAQTGFISVFVGIFPGDYARLKDGYKLYRIVSGQYVLIDSSLYSVVENNGSFEIFQLLASSLDYSQSIINQEDKLFLVLTDGLASIDYTDYWLDKWLLVNNESGDSKHFHELLADMYSLLAINSFFKLSGNYPFLVGPLDLIEFNYLTKSLYSVSDLTIDLFNGKSEITVIQNRNVSDVFTGNVGGVSAVVNPKIEITANFIIPSSLGSFVYAIEVSYKFTGFTSVAAKMYAVKYTDSLVNGGVATSEVLQSDVSNKSGTYSFSFGWQLEQQKEGWYEVRVEQGGVVSNKVFVQVKKPVVVQNTNKIQIVKKDLYQMAGQTLDYTISYDASVAVGSPKQHLQKVQTGTNLGISPVIITDISDVGVVHRAVAPSAGTWSVWVVDGVNVSNRLGFLRML